MLFFTFVGDNVGGLGCVVGPIPEGLGGLVFSQGQMDVWNYGFYMP